MSEKPHAYAGIGSRQITEREHKIIMNVAEKLSDNLLLYSGNANGADISFQEGSGGNCVVFLPYKNFNINKYDAWTLAGDCYVGNTIEGREAAKKYHPAPDKLNWKMMPMIARNYHQVMGIYPYPVVDFVLCCASRNRNKEIIGGTGHACRIAYANNIPVINIRDTNWQEELKSVLRNINWKE